MRYSKKRSKASELLESIEEKPEKVEKEPEIVVNPCIDDIINEKQYKERIYLETLSKFLNEKTEYSYMKITAFEDILEAWDEFLNDPKNGVDLSTMVNFTLKKNHIPLINKNYEMKRVNICKHCNKRHRKKCCDKFKRLEKTLNNHILNLRLI